MTHKQPLADFSYNRVTFHMTTDFIYFFFLNNLKEKEREKQQPKKRPKKKKNCESEALQDDVFLRCGADD